MGRVADIGWVEPATPIRGLDHLGVQAPCVALYTQLLPGITNVTDRARYYSFYPWLIRSFEQRYSDHSADEFRRVLRRAECLIALAAIRHSRVVNDGDEGRHGAGMVGRFTLLRIPDDEEAIALDDYASLEGPKRYFKNRLGGLGQYYFGPLRDLRVLDLVSSGEGSIPGYDKTRGAALADAFGHGVPGDAFFRLLEKSTIRWSDLDSLAAFCPCHLSSNPPERAALLDLFLPRSDSHHSPEATSRRLSLALALDFVSSAKQLDDYRVDDQFLAAAYSVTLPQGAPWALTPSLSRTRAGWATYQRNELLSIALQGFFAAVLATIENDHDGRLLNAAAAGDVCAALLPAGKAFRRQLVGDAVAALAERLPSLAAWQDEAHEIQRGWKILREGTEPGSAKTLVEEGVQVLLALLARGIDDNPYAEFDFEPDHFDAREVHLLSFRHAWETTWRDMTVEEWVRWLAIHWGVQRHLGVALRKLRGERRDTFRIRPLDQELRVIEVPPPAATVPRLGRTLQILRDLALTDLDDAGLTTITSEGLSELEACRAS